MLILNMALVSNNKVRLSTINPCGCSKHRGIFSTFGSV